ncbi:MAG: hypothetical protein HY326_10385 [Chloroflexi bacterium]|nr:hypothetical protein [Chloroflexota bacterium]
MSSEPHSGPRYLEYLLVTLVVVVLSGLALVVWPDKTGEVITAAWQFLLKQ